jgi:nickel/cobalt exporter
VTDAGARDLCSTPRQRDEEPHNRSPSPADPVGDEGRPCAARTATAGNGTDRISFATRSALAPGLGTAGPEPTRNPQHCRPLARRLSRRRLGVLSALVVPLFAWGVPAANAHPLGNATVNHYDGLQVYPDRIVDSAVEDVAEIPTFQRKRDIDRNGDGLLSLAERATYAGSQCSALSAGVSLQVDGKPITWRVSRSSYAERPGAIGLPAARLECRLESAKALSGSGELAFDDEWDGQGIGWHEVTAIGTGVSVKNSPFPAASISDELRKYPNDLLSSPLDVRRGTLKVESGGTGSTYALAKRLPVAGPAVRALNSLATEFNRTVGAKHLTVGVGLLALLLSLALGAGHAFLPGHGKTIMAAYLVGRRGRLRDVVTVGATVTITHTAGVLLLGLAITTTASFAPTQAEQYLGVISGLIVAGVGLGLLVSALRRRKRPVLPAALRQAPDVDGVATDLHPSPAAHVHATAVSTDAAHAEAGIVLAKTTHDHPHTGRPHVHAEDQDHPHPHVHAPDHAHATEHDHDHDHAQTSAVHPHRWGRTHSHAPPEGGFSRGGLVGLGVAGGLVPSPSALLVLLAATALGRTAFGVLLVLGYGVGMAGALSVAGLLLVKLRGRLDRLTASSRLARADRLLAVLPVLTALLVLAVGAGLTLRALGGTV